MKNVLQKRKASGFTIIEVMIVLAIAGLIMVIVFLAVPALQRNQRDNARQSIANRVKAEFETYAGNNQGQYPFKSGTGTGTISDFVNRYIGTGSAAPSSCNPPDGKVNTCDPTLATPVMTGASRTTGAPQAMATTYKTISQTVTHGEFYVVFGAKCDGENLTNSGAADAGSRTYAIIIGLDRDHTDYCVDNG
jgi:prepilin-type N-terminal cleavage/methylation domain-containing protein